MASLVAEGLELTAAADAAALDGHFAVRHAVFVADQGLFEGTDRDAHDDDPATVHVVATVGGAIVGAVRLYPLAGSVWKGDRLAVLPEARVGTVGAELVRFAVRTAGERGGDRMLAHVQLPNVRFFERLGWTRDGEPERYVGVMHQPMAIPLRTPGGPAAAAITTSGAPATDGRRIHPWAPVP
jgi:putative N-acetyltransferase (TIGR04045 family)